MDPENLFAKKSCSKNLNEQFDKELEMVQYYEVKTSLTVRNFFKQTEDHST